MNRPLLFIAADRRECAPWVAHWNNVRPLPLAVHWARAGKWNGRDVVAIANGAGARRAFAAAMVAPEVSAICNIGFCGALDRSLEAGEIFIATEVKNGAHTYPAAAPGHAPRPGQVASGIVASIDHVALTAAEKSVLHATGASVVEMEAAGAARAAQDLGVPFYCIRAVSDLADENFVNDLNASFMPDGRISVVRLMFGALRNPPKHIGELVRLNKRAAVAANNLGEFLANCAF